MPERDAGDWNPDDTSIRLPAISEQRGRLAAFREVRPLRELKPRERMRRSLTKPSRRQLVVGVLLALLGFGAVTQVHSNEVSRDYAGYRQQELIDLLEGLSVATERSRREVDKLESTKARLESDSTARQAALTQADERAEQLAILAGQLPVVGPGIRITLTPGESQLPLDLMLDLVQELRTAGAEAIELNDRVRVVAQTSFEVGGIGVLVDGTALEAPYVVEVIGNPRTLAEGVAFSRGPQERTIALGGSFEVAQSDRLVIESVRGGRAPTSSP